MDMAVAYMLKVFRGMGWADKVNLACDDNSYMGAGVTLAT